jgi:hypothetical protein
VAQPFVSRSGSHVNPTHPVSLESMNGPIRIKVTRTCSQSQMKTTFEVDCMEYPIVLELIFASQAVQTLLANERTNLLRNSMFEIPHCLRVRYNPNEHPAGR